MKVLHMVAFIILVIGGLNWGLVGIGELMGANWNVIDLLLGSWPLIESIVYILVGLSAIWLVFEHGKTCRTCSSK